MLQSSDCCDIKRNTTDNNGKYNEIITLHPLNLTLKISEIADYIIDLEYDIPMNNFDPRISLRNINFIIACYIWYYIREEEENWEIIKPLTAQQMEISEQHLIKSHYKYKSKRYFNQQPGMYNTAQRIPKSLHIASTVVIASSVNAATFCVGGAVDLFNKNVNNIVRILTETLFAKDTIIKLPNIPLDICASIMIGGVVGAATLIAIPVATFSSVGLYLGNGTDLSDIETWQYIGETKFNHWTQDVDQY